MSVPGLSLTSAPASPDMIVSEVLCIVQNRFTKVPKNDLITSLYEFYTYDEILLAKKTLFDFAASLKVDYVTTYTERKGANRLRATTEDVIALYTVLDANKAKLPQFVAANPLRLPPTAATTTAASSDVAALAALVYELRDQVATLTTTIGQLRGAGPCMQWPTVGAVNGDNGGIAAPQAATAAPKTSWADHVAALAANPAPFQETPRPMPSPPSPPKSGPTLVGRRQTSTSTAVKAVPRQLVCFVGRLHADTTAESLHDYLEEAGIMNADCRRLEARNGRIFKTAAFRVACSPEYRELFYDESNWPEGAELRDWVYRPRNGAT